MKTSFVPRIDFITSYDQKVHDLERNRDRGVCEHENRAILAVYPADFTQKGVYDDKLERKKSQKTQMMLN